MDKLKKIVAEAAISYIEPDSIIGVGTGSTVNFFIDALEPLKHSIKGAVSSSKQSAERLKKIGIQVFDMNEISDLPIYFDGADEINSCLQMIKGGGGALTHEKIIASLAKQFICIVDSSKQVQVLGKFPVPIEVIPMARSHIARQIVIDFQGEPVYRNGVTTDGNIILDVHNLKIHDPLTMETALNQLPGVVSNGIFALQKATTVLVANKTGAYITIK